MKVHFFINILLNTIAEEFFKDISFNSCTYFLTFFKNIFLRTHFLSFSYTPKILFSLFECYELHILFLCIVALKIKILIAMFIANIILFDIIQFL